jgi:WXXGXW repeat (2 copies)
MKSIHKALLASLLFGAATLMTTPAILASDLTVAVAPPADRHEAAPKPRPGYVWAPGYWAWSGRFYSWTSGTWVVEHGKGQQYVAARWEQIGSQYHFLPGHWSAGNATEAKSTLQAQGN